MVRYLPDGSLDTDFGSGGMVFTNLGEGDDYATSILIQADHKIILGGVGVMAGTHNDFALARYNSDGSIDASFGTGGFVTTDVQGYTDELTDLAIQTIEGVDKIVAGGTVYTSTYHRDVILLRYTMQGILDASFGTGGKVVTNYQTENNVYDIAVQSNNKILVVTCFTSLVTGDDFTLFRYTTDGALDADFGSSGIKNIDLGNMYERSYGFVLHGDSIILAGYTNSFYGDPGSKDYAMLSLDPDGNLVTSFGTGGQIKGYFAQGLNTVFTATAFQNVDGESKLLVTGTSMDDFMLGRLNADGSIDTSFGNNGYILSHIWGKDTARTVAIQNINGVEKILVGGVTYEWESGSPYFAVARYHVDGTPDNSFGFEGRYIVGIANIDLPNAMAVQNDGKILLAAQLGYVDYNTETTTYEFGVVRMNPDGGLDLSFGTDGHVTTDISGFADSAVAIAIQPGGKILVAGQAMNASGNSDFVVVRYTTAGALDASFGTGGKAITDFNGYNDVATSIVVQPDGRILLAGTATRSNSGNMDQDFALARYTSKGKPDLSFGTQGKLTTDFNSYNDLGRSMIMQNDGRLIVTGMTGVANQYDIALARYEMNGAMDTSFVADKSGKLISHFGYSEMMAASIWNNDRLYVAGAADIIAGFPYFPNTAMMAVYKTSETTLPAISINNASVNEGFNATLTLTLDQASSAPITVIYATEDVTALGKGKNQDYKGIKTTVTIPAGQTTADIVIPTYQDNLTTEGTETFHVHLSLSNQMAGLATFSDDMGIVTIYDMPAPIFLRPESYVQDKSTTGRLSVIAYPNPSNGQFTLQLQGEQAGAVTVSIMDASGRIVETRTGVQAKVSVQFGNSYRPGVYYVKVVQGTETITMKLLKL